MAFGDDLQEQQWFGGEGNGPLTQVDPATTAPVQPSPWEYEQAQNTGFNWTPQQLGWNDEQAKRFSDAGITNLPGWFSNNLVYGDAFNLHGRDPIDMYINLYNTPYEQATSQWNASSDQFNRLFRTEQNGPLITDVNTDAAKEAYVRNAFSQMNNAKDSWWDRNSGMVMGLGSIAWPALWAVGGEALMAPEAAAGGEGAAAGAGGALSSEATMAISDMMVADAVAAGGAAGADVGMGAGTSWLTEMGWPASYGFTPTEIGNYLAGTTGISGLSSLGDIDWSKLGTSLGKSMLGATGGTTAQTPMVFNSSSQAPSAGAAVPAAPTGFNASSPIVPATMPTGSVMPAFADKEDKKDYMKYFSTLF